MSQFCSNHEYTFRGLERFGREMTLFGFGESELKVPAEVTSIAEDGSPMYKLEHMSFFFHTSFTKKMFFCLEFPESIPPDSNVLLQKSFLLFFPSLIFFAILPS